MARNTKLFSDLDLNFIAHPVSKDIVRKYDEQAIKASLKNLILTKNFERPFHSEIGSPIKALLFENPNPMVLASFRKVIIDLINNFEPRVDVIDVNVNVQEDSNAVYISILFKIANTERPITFDFALERTR